MVNNFLISAIHFISGLYDQIWHMWLILKIWKLCKMVWFLGQSYKAHRLVLAACSTHFSKIFSNSPLHGQLIIILDGTRSQDLEILLQFMYRGVAFLPSDRIESVLRTGEVLQVFTTTPPTPYNQLHFYKIIN